MKIRPVRAEMLLVDRRRDTMKLKIACRNFANTPENRHLKQRKATGMGEGRKP